jgi:predicted Rossmann fold flavoprotein
MSQALPHIVIGGGAAGFFGACALARKSHERRVILLEKTKKLLTKVKISGGSRCNVTHDCFDPKKLATHYPRGSKELIGPFHSFGPKETIHWFQERGVQLKTEEDGRIFPVTDDSETIIQCLMQEAKDVGVEICLEEGVKHIMPEKNSFTISCDSGEKITARSLLIATGSSRPMYDIIASLGHTIQPPVPSLFTFNIPTSPLLDLAGISVHRIKVSIPRIGLEQEGPMLLTHWGFSGPAILKLSAWGARELAHEDYKAIVTINWLPELGYQALASKLEALRKECSKELVHSEARFGLPKNLFKRLAELSGIDSKKKWNDLSQKQLLAFAEILHRSSYAMDGKTTYKQEFVTAGGVLRSEVDFKTMQSKLLPALFFAGEVLDIDGITGGFNFQNAWTTSWIAAGAMAAL